MARLLTCYLFVTSRTWSLLSYLTATARTLSPTIIYLNIQLRFILGLINVYADYLNKQNTSS